MNKNEYLSVIEKLNEEIICLKSSKEYQLGSKISKKKSLLKTLNMVKIHFKMKKYNHPEPEKNTYKVLNDISLENKKIAVYTSIVGGYDDIKEPLITSSNCDYFLFTDQEVNSTIWKVKKISKEIEKLKNATKINRYFKMNPHLLFPDYDYAIYIDGSILIVSDITEFINCMNLEYGLAFHKHRYRKCIYEEIEACQILKKGNYKKLKEQGKRYLTEKFPKNFGMLECGIIVSDLKNKKSKEILEKWYEEFLESESLRDQISLPYVLWKENILPTYLSTLGDNIYKNNKIRIETTHKR